MFVRVAAKTGAAILALLLAAVPMMACVRPGATMTPAEHECCKRMATLCGHSGMAKSHGCCQSQASPNDFHAVKTTSLNLEHSFVQLYLQPADVQVFAVANPILGDRNPSATHSPPGLISASTTILRI